MNLEDEHIDRIVRVEELGIKNLEQWIFEHDVVELCTAVKGPMLCRLLDEGATKVIYLDPDIALFGDLDEVVQLLDSHDVILTPHLLAPESDDEAIADNEIGAMAHGIYNLGFIAVANTNEGRRFAQWWSDRLLKFCFDDLPHGLFTDQRWCDHVPVFFPTSYILRDPGYNVASWNLGRRPISFANDGRIYAAGHQLRFFHFTKVTGVGETMLEKYCGGKVAIFEIIKWYLERLKVNAAPLPKGWWYYGKYENGSEILRKQRVAYRKNPALKSKFPDPFKANGSRFFSGRPMVIPPFLKELWK